MKKSGFSLIEVALALAIVGFALIALVALFPMGLNSNQQSVEQSRAIQAMNAVASGIWGMTPLGTGTSYQLAAPLGSTTLVIGAQPIVASWGLKENGLLATANDWADNPDLRGTVYLRCTPPASPNAIGTAYISVAWPGSAQYVATGGSSGWTKQQGYVETMIYFSLP